MAPPIHLRVSKRATGSLPNSPHIGVSRTFLKVVDMNCNAVGIGAVVIGSCSCREGNVKNISGTSSLHQILLTNCPASNGSVIFSH